MTYLDRIHREAVADYQEQFQDGEITEAELADLLEGLEDGYQRAIEVLAESREESRYELR